MINKTQSYFLELVDASIHGTFVPSKPEGVSFTDVYNLAQQHSLEALTYLAIERLEEGPKGKLLTLWSERFYKSVIIDTEQKNTFDNTLGKMKECGAQIMPIKGIVMKEYYPESSMRSMADIDILYRHTRRKDMHKSMLAGGYLVKSHDIVKYHDTYESKSGISVELHRSLLSRSDRLYSYFEQVWKRAKNADGIYKMTPEDEYLYLIAHQAKHFFESGLGVRPIVDIYIFKRAHKDALDMKYVRKILGRAKLVKFEKILSALADKWFTGVSSEYVNDDIEEFFLACEPHGSSTNLRINLTRRMLEEGVTLPGAKRKYVLSQFFPSYKTMCEEYQSLNKAPILLPAFWTHRLFGVLFSEKNSLKKRFITAGKSIGQTDEREADLVRRVYQYFID